MGSLMGRASSDKTHHRRAWGVCNGRVEGERGEGRVFVIVVAVCVCDCMDGCG